MKLAVRRSYLHFALGLSAFFAAAAPSVARACWDGYAASVGRVFIGVADDRPWDPGSARAVARWGARIDALLPANTLLNAQFNTVTFCQEAKDGCGETLGEAQLPSLESLPTLFSSVAKLTRASPAAVRRARAIDAQPFTLQVFAARAERRAKAIAARIDESGAGRHGFYEAGGFPAFNSTAHVVRGEDAAGRPLFRVVVGAFLDRKEAASLGDSIKTQLGIQGFVRPL